MSDPHTAPLSPGTGYWSWFGFWAQFVVLGALAVWGAFFASDGETDDYTCGMLLVIAAIALAFLRLKAWFDGRSGSWNAFLLVDDLPNLTVVIPLFALIGLAALFVAAGAKGSLQNGGVALFIASGLIVFLNIKRVFDNRDAHR
jgi:ABC-type uncharacterized transport system permease subunit